MKPNRFDYVAYDDEAKRCQAEAKKIMLALEYFIAGELVDGRPVQNALKALEECYMWIGKAIRDEQIQRNTDTMLEERRSNS